MNGTIPLNDGKSRTGVYSAGSSGKVKSWSKWNNYEEYYNFQKAIRKNLIEENGKKPLVWEDIVWRIVAKYRKENSSYSKYEKDLKAELEKALIQD